MTAKKFIFATRKCYTYILILVGLLHYPMLYAQPDDVGGYINNHRKPGGSINALKRLVSSDSINLGHILQLGFLWENASQYDSALWAFSRALELEGENSDALFGQARCFAASGRVKSAIAAFNELINRDSTNRLARLQFARLLKREGKYRDALSHFMKLSATDSTNSFLLEQLGDCGVKLGNPGLALSAYQQGYSYNPRNMPLAAK
jgi:tetratricopeptide (TPR) repeat protein